MKYRIQQTEQLTRNTTRFYLEPAEREVLVYQAGQYINVLYPNGSSMPFSIANAPRADNVLELHVKHLKEDAATAAFLRQVTDSQSISFSGPFGNSIYHQEPDWPIIFIAIGTGFAPFKAIIEQAIQQSDSRLMHLFWRVRQPQDFYLLDLPRQWCETLPQFRYTPVLSRPDEKGNWRGDIGFARDLVVKDYPDLSHFQVYAAGPLEMVNACLELFAQHGLQQRLLYSDMFDFLQQD